MDGSVKAFIVLTEESACSNADMAPSEYMLCALTVNILTSVNFCCDCSCVRKQANFSANTAFFASVSPTAIY